MSLKTYRIYLNNHLTPNHTQTVISTGISQLGYFKSEFLEGLVN